MKIAHREEATEFKNGDTCIAYEYPLKDKEGDFTLVVSCAPAWYPEQHKVID